MGNFSKNIKNTQTKTVQKLQNVFELVFKNESKKQAVQRGFYKLQKIVFQNFQKIMAFASHKFFVINPNCVTIYEPFINLSSVFN